ncbi:hypothetical protein DFP72DRAFT_895864 [Ephemerocybe angulata]|uniref:Uncharacterized protein n=1 Tax=Ephemerocybe angulata TaxID=980116 RepID=A0A8H6I142_9AGAR|nr:hypothetical protein DFP72DRAFT_895864 [Tulosesus angulatus]
MVSSCGSCNAKNMVSIPRDIYYVVTSGSGGIGIFTNSSIADMFVSNTKGAHRIRTTSLDEAVQHLSVACMAGSIQINPHRVK